MGEWGYTSLNGFVTLLQFLEILVDPGFHYRPIHHSNRKGKVNKAPKSAL